MNTGLSINFIHEAALSYAKQHDGKGLQLACAVESIQWYEGYANEGADGLIVAGNWNTIDTYNCETERREPIPGGDVMVRLGEILERAGCEIVWSDMVTGCDDCGRCIETEPDSYHWRPEFVHGDGEIYCLACMDGNWQEELDGLAKSNGVTSVADLDPSEYGYTAVRELRFGWDGWHKPERLVEQMRGRDYFLQATHSRQFGSTCILWVPDDDVANLPEQIEGDEIDE